MVQPVRSGSYKRVSRALECFDVGITVIGQGISAILMGLTGLFGTRCTTQNQSIFVDQQPYGKTWGLGGAHQHMAYQASADLRQQYRVSLSHPLGLKACA